VKAAKKLGKLTGEHERAARVRHEALGAAAGAATGAAAGAVAGPPGVVVGGLVGGVAGAIAAVALERAEDDNAAESRRLDDAIGVSGGDLGASCLLHPPATTGTYSAASAGASSSSGDSVAEGPLQAPGDG
jgi:hypothetical protein